VLNGNIINLYKHNLNEVFKTKDIKKQRSEWLKNALDKNMSANMGHKDLLSFITKLYEKSYSALDLINILENVNVVPDLTIEKRYELLINFNKIRKEFRNEKILMLFILNFAFLSSNESLENISFM
jgi:hypothetical protein